MISLSLSLSLSLSPSLSPSLSLSLTHRQNSHSKLNPCLPTIVMSTGAVVNPPGAGGIGGEPASSGQGTRPLTSEAIFRIEVSLSSRKSSAIVMKTTARLYALEGAVPAVPGSSPG